jgi:hypothetical protein
VHADRGATRTGGENRPAAEQGEQRTAAGRADADPEQVGEAAADGDVGTDAGRAVGGS